MGIFRLKYRAQLLAHRVCVARGLMEGKPARTSLVHFPSPSLPLSLSLFLRAFEAEFVLLLPQSLAEGGFKLGLQGDLIGCCTGNGGKLSNK